MKLSQFGLVFSAILLFAIAGCGRPNEPTVSADRDALSAYLESFGDDTEQNADDGNK